MMTHALDFFGSTPFSGCCQLDIFQELAQLFEPEQDMKKRARVPARVMQNTSVGRLRPNPLNEQRATFTDFRERNLHTCSFGGPYKNLLRESLKGNGPD